MRQVGVGSLHIAHTTKGEHSDRKPFDSAFWHNGARRTWYVKPSEDAGSSLTIGLFDKKRNVGPQLPAVGFHITFTEDRTIYTPVDVAGVQDLSAQLPLWVDGGGPHSSDQERALLRWSLLGLFSS